MAAHVTSRNRRALLAFAVAVVLLPGLAVACGSGTEARTGESGPQPVKLRLGYFPNITHAQALVGLARGTYADRLGPNVKLQTKTFNAGPAAIEALFAGEIDAAYIGPNPAINGYVRSQGKALRIVAGATSGGALLIVRASRGIESPADLAGKKLATPQLGNTQDVALRSYLKANGLGAREDGGNVNVVPAANPDILTLFRRGSIDGAWVPEPWATRLVQEAGGKVFLDERTLWPGGDFITTQLIVRTGFLDKHPDVVENLLRAHVETTAWINANPEEAKKLVNQGIKDVSGAALPEAVVDAAWANLRFVNDPLAATLRKSAEDAFRLGFLGDSDPDLGGIYALDALNAVLREQGLPAVSDQED